MATHFIVRRIDKDPEPNGIDALVFQDFETIPGCPIVIVEDIAGCLHLLQPAHIGPFGESLGLPRWPAGKQGRHITPG